MIRFILALLAATMCLATSIEAAVISRDWKTPGDGLLTYDDVNQREWLDLSQTLLSSQFPGTGSGRALFESRYQYVVSQTAPGGLFAGFSIAKSADVVALGQSAGVNTSTLDFTVNSVATRAVIELLGPTPYPGPHLLISYGMLDELSGQLQDIRVLARFNMNNTHAGLQISANLDIDPVTLFGVWMYRAVPEPCSGSSIFIAIYAFAALMPGVSRGRTTLHGVARHGTSSA